MTSGEAVSPIWADAVLAARLFAVDPVGLGGVSLRSPAGPVRDRWLALLKSHLPVGAPIKRVPLHIADDRLLGGLDLAATLSAGRPIAERGILAEADGGVVLLAMAERLTVTSAARIAAVLDTGEIALERDGLSSRRSACIGVVALDEGIAEDEKPPPSLLARFAFLLDLNLIAPADAIDVMGGCDIEVARALLPGVTVPAATVNALCAAATALGIASLRAVTHALRVARALAALDGRRQATDEDGALAARLVYAPRATIMPAAPDQPQEPAPPEHTDGEPPDSATAEQCLSELMIEAVKAVLPPDMLAMLARQSGRQGPASAGRVGEKRIMTQGGRPIGVRQGELRPGAYLNVVETLRAAAGWQTIRRRSQPAGALRRVEVRRDDFRIVRRQQRRATTTIFVVDASGSSALNRLGEAKGAVELLLADCYVRRDQVALIAFRGRDADLILPPTRSLVRAKRGLANLAGGGGTPLASGIAAATVLVEALRRKGQTTTVVLLTDGQANIGRSGEPGRPQAEQDALAAARTLRIAGTSALLLDTARRPEPLARSVAAEMDARYLPLPRADASAISQAVRATAALDRAALR